MPFLESIWIKSVTLLYDVLPIWVNYLNPAISYNVTLRRTLATTLYRLAATISTPHRTGAGVRRAVRQISAGALNHMSQRAP